MKKHKLFSGLAMMLIIIIIVAFIVLDLNPLYIIDNFISEKLATVE